MPKNPGPRLYLLAQAYLCMVLHIVMYICMYVYTHLWIDM